MFKRPLRRKKIDSSPKCENEGHYQYLNDEEKRIKLQF